ncbi:MAG: PAS domain S-box protein [Planctomycetota bacterium]
MKDKTVNSSDKLQLEIPLKHKALFDVLNNLSVCVVVLNRKGEIVLFNKAAQQLTGYSLDNLKGKPIWSEFTPPDEIEKVKAMFVGLKNAKSIEPMERVWKSKTGQDRWIRWSANIILNDSNEVEYIIGTGIDLTSQKEAENTLRNNETFLNSVFSSIQDGVSVLDNDYNILKVNRSMEKWYEHAMPLVGKKCYQAYHLREKPCEICPTRKTLETNQPAFEVVPKTGLKGKIVGWQGLYTFPLMNNVTSKQLGVIEYVRDISKEKQVEEDLKESEEKYRTIIENANDIIWTLDINGNFTFANRQAEITTGHNLESWIGKSFTPLVHPNDVTIVNETAEKVLAGESQQLTIRLYNRNGVLITAAINAAPIYKKGVVAGMVCFGRDITARKMMEDALHQSEKRYRILAETAQDIIFIVDYNGVVQYVNTCAANVLRKNQAELIGKNIGDLFPVETGSRFKTNIQKVFDSGQPLYIRDQTKYPTGEVWLGSWLAPIKNASKNVTSVMGISRDVTKQKQVEDALYESESKYRNLVENIQDGIFVIQDTKTQFVNDAFVKMFGYPVEEIIGSDFRKFIAPEDVATVEERYFKRQSGEKIPKEYDFRIIHKDGKTKVPVNLTVGIITYKNRVATMGTLKDITAHKLAEAALKQSLNQTQKTLKGIVNTLSFIAEKRDPYTAGHQFNTARLAEAIAKEMNLPEEKIECIRIAAILHDIGKISVPAEILSKPGKLTETELDIIKIHPQSGFEILQNIEFPWPIAQVIHQHHERLNGSGYPLGISGKDILIESKILGVADVVESMALERPYRAVKGLNAALDEITNNKGLLYDSEAVDACVRLFKEKGFKLG